MSQARAQRRRARARRQGFTLIEVMMSLAIMTVGALGIMALQQAATRGNMEARQMTAATNINRIWIERLRADTLLWNATTVPAGFENTRYISVLESEPGTDWFAPISGDGVVDSYAFDYFGNDTEEEADTYFCTHIRLRWIRQGSMLRADVRTFWHDRDNVGQFPGCAVGEETEVTTELAATPTGLRAVYASDILRWHQLPTN